MENATTTLSLIALSALGGNDPAELTLLQRSLAEHLPVLVSLWGAVWCTVLAWILYTLWLEGDPDA